MFKFTINNIEVEQGISNWEDISIAVKRDDTNRIVRLDMPQEMTFTGECFEIIKNEFDANGYCTTVSVRIEKEVSNNSIAYKQFFSGLIFINECEFDMFNSVVIVPIRDDSFISRINNNRLIEFNVGSDTTKNSVTMTAVSPMYITMYNQTTGTANGGFVTAGDRLMYDWFEVFQNCVLFLTDNQVTVSSTWYTNLDDNKKIALVYGLEMRLANGVYDNFFITFNDLTEDIFKIYNLWMTIDSDNVLSLEEENYYYNSVNLFTFEKVMDVKQTFLQDKFYSNVTFGSSDALDTGAFPIIRFISFQNENYYIGGKCNIQNTLDLSIGFLETDANLIEDVLLTGNDGFDKKVFIVQYDSSISEATKNLLTPLTGFYYNLDLANIIIAERYSLSSGMFSVLNSFEDRFKATATSNGLFNLNQFTDDIDPLPAFGPANEVEWNDDTNSPNFNSNSRFNSVNNTYTANSTGYYSFYVNWQVTIQILDKTDTNGVMLYQRVISLGSGIDQTTLMTIVGSGIDHLGATGTYNVECYINDLFIEAGDTVYFIIADFGQNTTRTISSYCYFNIRFDSGSFGECLTTPISGGEYVPSNPDIFKASLFTFEKKMTQAEVDLLLDTPYKAFNFNQDGVNNKKVWANEISINLLDNTANIEAISDLENSK